MGIGVVSSTGDEIALNAGVGTSMLSEWVALKYALGLAYVKYKDDPSLKFRIYGDNLTVIRQINGEFAIANDRLKAESEVCFKILDKLGDSVVSISHVYREYNREADRLSKIGRSK